MPPPSPPPRLRLIYKHVAKTGGQSIISALRVEHGDLLADRTIVIRSEREMITAEDARDAYIISSIRNPCALYLSLWAWGVAGHGRYNTQFAQLHKDSPVLSKVFSTSPANVSAFAAFARASAGEFSRRYRDYIPSLINVDCWVHTETVDADFPACLAAFAAQAAPHLRARLAKPGTRFGLSRNVSSYNVHGSGHGACLDYYRHDLALQQDIRRADGVLFQAFPEYGGACCSTPVTQRVARSVQTKI
mmetsp:Transcript_9253/g.21499  ORF Transcript_9253/g.21499 Transcript_9253/m.21499 type:complete len:247 (+) Transcript_9253:22-762(+)